MALVKTWLGLDCCVPVTQKHGEKWHGNTNVYVCVSNNVHSQMLHTCCSKITLVDVMWLASAKCRDHHNASSRKLADSVLSGKGGGGIWTAFKLLVCMQCTFH